MPDFPGLDSFAGRRYHTGHWPHEGVDFTGQRVGVIGTGSSAIQSIPIIAEQAAHLFVFQRTPNFSVPAHNAPARPGARARVKANYAEHRQQARESRVGFVVRAQRRVRPGGCRPRSASASTRRAGTRGGLGFTATFADLLTDQDANDTAAEFVRAKIRAIVHDPAVAEALMPQRLPDRHQAPVRRHRLLRDLQPRQRHAGRPPHDADRGDHAATGVRTRDGRVRGRQPRVRHRLRRDDRRAARRSTSAAGAARALREKWADGPRTYLGLAVAGFPNLFTITGPGSPSVLSNMIVSIEQHVDWIADCLAHLRERGLRAHRGRRARPRRRGWRTSTRSATSTLYPRANSWYMGANIPGKPRVFMPYIGGVGTYRQKCDEVAAKGYEGFTLTSGR